MGVDPNDLEHMTVRQVAKIFCRTDQTIWRWLNNGVFKHARRAPCGGWLIPRFEVVRLLNSGTVSVHDSK